MTEALLFAGIGSLVTVSGATLFVSVLALRSARRSVELAEDCMKRLREEQARFLAVLREERRFPEEELEQEQYLGAPRRVERLNREHLLPRQEQVRLAEELERERCAHRDAEQRIDRLQREVQKLREVRWESPAPVLAGLQEDRLETREPVEEKPLPTQKAQGESRSPRPASFLETGSGAAGGPPEGKGSRRAVWHPHPDDSADRGKTSAGGERPRSDTPVTMFRKHYDKYLENYQGYVELAEKLYRMRNSGEVPPGSPGEREWEKRLRRVNDGIERTTARLDILEEHNPGLAADDRVSRRAGLSRRHSELERNKQNHRSS